MQIDNEFDKFRLYVSDRRNDVLTIWNTSNGAFIDKLDIDAPVDVNFTGSSFYVSSRVFEDNIRNGKLITIKKGGNCIFEIDKESLEIKRRIMGNWFSPRLLNIELNGNLQIVARTLNDNVIKSEIRYFLTIDKNGKIIEKVETHGLHILGDLKFVKNKIIASFYNKLKIFEFW